MVIILYEQDDIVFGLVYISLFLLSLHVIEILFACNVEAQSMEEGSKTILKLFFSFSEIPTSRYSIQQYFHKQTLFEWGVGCCPGSVRRNATQNGRVVEHNDFWVFEMGKVR